jgi:hypothetical protein
MGGQWATGRPLGFILVDSHVGLDWRLGVHEVNQIQGGTGRPRNFF